MEVAKERGGNKQSKEVDSFINNGPYDSFAKNLVYKIMKLACGVGPYHPDNKPTQSGFVKLVSGAVGDFFISQARVDRDLSEASDKPERLASFPPTHFKILDDQTRDSRPYDWQVEDRPYDWQIDDSYLAAPQGAPKQPELLQENHSLEG